MGLPKGQRAASVAGSIAEQLGRAGLSIWPDFLSGMELQAVQTDVEAIEQSAGFHRAGTGQGAGNDLRDLVRSDSVHWVDRARATPPQTMLWGKLDSLRQAFNRTLYLGLSAFDGHYACYPAGGFYQRHLDCFAQDQDRVVSLVLFLNRRWQSADAGQLRIYRADAPIDVAPIGGTLVCFLSVETEHEVLLSHAVRRTFTGWFQSPRRWRPAKA